MSKVFIDLYDVFKTTQFYNDNLNGGQLNLSYFRQIAQNRWPWIVQNWNTLYKRFLTSANGDQDQMMALESLNTEVASYNLGNRQNPFNSEEKLIKFDTFLEQISIAELKLTPDEQTNYLVELNTISQLDTASFNSALTLLRKEEFIFASSIGLGDPDSAKFLGLKEVTQRREPTISDLDRLDQMDELYQIIQGIIFNLQLTEKRAPNLLSFDAQSLTPQSGVTIQDIYLSYIPKPYELSLENMAQKYLGSKDRWYELATVNNLQPPYIDEKGIKISLLAPAALNNVIISDENKDIIFVGQKINIGSYKFREETRIIEKITLNDNQTMIVYMSGSQNLQKFLSSEGAFVRAYKPHTTRPGQYVLIPQTQAGFSPRAHKTPDSDTLRRLSVAFQNFGVDVATDVGGDFQVDANGNFKYVYGLPAVRKAILNAVKTTRGELPFHPTYGVNMQIGDRFFGTLSEAMLTGEILRDSLLSDGRFSQILIDKIATTGTSLSIGLLVGLEGSNELIPLSFIS